MAIRVIVLTAVAMAGWAQQPEPIYSNWPALLQPGEVLELYGRHLGPASRGVQVFVGDTSAELLYVSENQINFRIPADAPELGTAPIKVCVQQWCSDPVELRFSTRTSYIHVQGRAYVHMPVWIEALQPQGEIYYPYMTVPWIFSGEAFELRHNGRTVQPLREGGPGFIGGGTIAPQGSPRSRLPLHLLYRFDEPGSYSVRLTVWKTGQEIASQSEWTDFTVETFPDAERDQWLREQAGRIAGATPGQLVGDVIPSLLAFPDEKALRVLLPLLDHEDNLVKQFAHNSLLMFDHELLERYGHGQDTFVFIH